MGAELMVEGPFDDVRSYLVNTVCLYKGEPVLVRRSDGAHRIQVSFLKDLFLIETVDYRIKDFRYQATPLGYINYHGEAAYLKRFPGSSRSPALTRECICIEPDYLASHLDSQPNPEDNWFLTNEMSSCIKGEHPSFKEALEKMRNGEVGSIAFHRHYALSNLNRGRMKLVKRGIDDLGFITDDRILLFDERNKVTIKKFLAGMEEEFNVSAL